MAQKNIIVTFNHPAAIANTIRWARIDNTVTPVYTTVYGVTVSPYIIENVPNGQYRIFITPIYGDGRICDEILFETPSCTGITALSVIVEATSPGNQFVVSYTADITVAQVMVNIQNPKGGFSSQVFTNDGNDIDIPVPDNIFGTFNISMSPVCDADTGWIGTSTAPVFVVVNPDNNSTFTNNATGDMSPTSLTAYSIGSEIIFTSANVADGGGVVNFYLADGLYNSLVIAYGSGTVAAATATTDSGVVNGVIAGGTITFTNVTVLNGTGVIINVT